MSEAVTYACVCVCVCMYICIYINTRYTYEYFLCRPLLHVFVLSIDFSIELGRKKNYFNK
jgi:hypothetical protein